jgi:hypothetical protein
LLYQLSYTLLQAAAAVSRDSGTYGRGGHGSTHFGVTLNRSQAESPETG